LDHGSTVEAGCGAYYSATPDPAMASESLTLVLSFSCSPNQFVTYPQVNLFVGAGASHGGQTLGGYVQQVSPSACTQDPSTPTSTCVFGPQAPGVYTAEFDWGLGDGGTGIALGRPGNQCWEWPEGGYRCSATLEVVVT
jgi:hypothetical protein